MSTTWMDCDEGAAVGTVVFCATICDTNHARTTKEASARPFSKNMSGEKVLRGWCGSTNNVDVQATGAGVVTRISERADGLRCQVRRLPDDDQRVLALCEELGVTA